MENKISNYVLTNDNRQRVADKLEAIAGRLMVEGITAGNYSRRIAEEKLAPCVGGPCLIELLGSFEADVLQIIEREEMVA